MVEYSKTAVMGVKCPHCGAQPGKRCRSPNGAVADLHNERKVLVYPRYSRGEHGLKRGRVGKFRVYAVAFVIKPSAELHTAVALARTPVAVLERLRLRVREQHGIELDETDVQVTEVLVTDGDQLVLIGVDT